jgi:hypothetical protein
MEPSALLAELRALADDVPDFGAFTPTSRVHHQWLGKVHALIQQCDPSEAQSVKSYMGFVGMSIASDAFLSTIVGILYRVIARLEAEVPKQGSQAFGPGAVYDFFKSLRDLLASANQTILIVDPYLDEQIFDTYLAAVSPNVAVRLLGGKKVPGLKPALAKFISQSKMNIEARISGAIHDRVIFLDGRSCWVLGQSVKDAAKNKPTYLAPLDHDTAKLKVAAYEEIWRVAGVL